MALERLYEALNRLSETHPEWTAPKEASEFFFHVRDFLEVYERLDEHYEVYMEHTSQGTFQINLLCVNPAERFAGMLRTGHFNYILFGNTFANSLLQGASRTR